MLFTTVALFLAAVSPAIATRSHAVTRHGKFQGHASNTLQKRGHEARAPKAAASCNTGAEITITAPKPNIFLGLTDVEAANVTSFLHQQKSLNLTAVANLTA